MFCKVQLLHNFFFVFFLLFVLGDVSHIVNKYVRNEIVYYIIKSRSVSFCVQRLKTETQLRLTTGRSTKRPSTLNDIPGE
jgi:hypothetical protein